MLSLEQILNYQHLIIIIAIMGVLEAIKVTLRVLKIRKHKAIEIIMPYMPMIFGCGVAFIPGAITADTLGFRLMIGVAMGALGGQVWKIVKTKLDLLKGRL